jgi:hypothetical protein
MHKKTQREEWLSEVQASQHNVVFPDTVKNEVRFWRNIGKQPYNVTTKVGLSLLGLMGWGFLATILVASFRAGQLWKLLLCFGLFWGPIFGLIAWATRRALRNAHNAQRGSRPSRHPKH